MIKLLAPFFALTGATLPAIEVELDFTVQPNSQVTQNYQIGTAFTSDSFNASTSYSGNLLATAEVNPGNGTIESIAFTGGSLIVGDITRNLSLVVGSTPYTIIFSTSGVTRTANSSQVDVLENGFLNGTLHFTSFTDGTITVTNFLTNPGTPSVTETADLSQESSDLVSPNIISPASTGATSVSASVVDSTLLQRNYQAQLFSQLQAPALSPSATIQAAGAGPNQRFTQSYFEFGSLSAIASFSLPTPFGQWALAEGLVLTTGLESNANGYPYSLLYALDLPAETSALPLSFPQSQPLIAILTLPADGLRRRITVEYSPDLDTPFSPIADSFLLDGANSLNAGQTGDARIAFPTGERGFIRFAAP